MTDQPRPVWLDQRLAGVIAYAKARAEADWKDEAHAAELGEILAAWYAAPADAPEAVKQAIRDYYAHSVEGVEFEHQAVLRALGHPS